MKYDAIVVLTLTITVNVEADNDQDAAHLALRRMIDLKCEVEATHDLDINEHDYAVTSIVDENGVSYGRYANHGTD